MISMSGVSKVSMAVVPRPAAPGILLEMQICGHHANYWIRICLLKRPQVFYCTLKSEKHWSREAENESTTVIPSTFQGASILVYQAGDFFL